MASLKKLANETVLYGLSSILGRFINWLMVPLYTTVFQEPNYPQAEYGIQTKTMSIVAVLIVLLTYGMETGYFRYASDKAEDRKAIFSTTTTSLLITGAIFILFCLLFTPSISSYLYLENRSYLVGILAVTLAIDAYSTIPFAKLRLDGRSLRFASLKLINIGINVAGNLFFLVLCPYLLSQNPDSIIGSIYQHDVGIGYVFISYLIASVITLLLLIPELQLARFQIDISVVKKLLKYSFPILIVGLASNINLNFDKLAMDSFLRSSDVMKDVGIYGAAAKLGVIMTLFTQAYRYAFEPFFFSNKTAENAKQLYADALKYFFLIGLLTFLAVTFYIDQIALLLGKSYRSGIIVVPLILLANLFLGVYYSLSLWYKLTDKTHWGAYMAIGGCIVTIVLNVILVPRIGYIGAAYAFCISALLMTIASYIIGQRYYTVPYQMRCILLYFALAIGLFALSQWIIFPSLWMTLVFRTVLLLGFLFIIIKKEPQLERLLRGFFPLR